MDKVVVLISAVLLFVSGQTNSENSDDALIANVFPTAGSGDGFNPNKGGCKCIPFYLCRNGTQLRDGAGLINYRRITPICDCECADYTERCCYVPPERNPNVVSTKKPHLSTSTPYPGDDITSTTSTTPKVPTKSKPNVSTAKPSKKPKCGMRRVNLFETRIMGAKNKTKSSEFPWMVAIFHNEENNGGTAKRYMCAGSLIHERVVMTVAHCAKQLDLERTVLRAGAWDLNSNDEPYPHQDRFVSQIISHNSFNSRFVTNDIALLVTTTPFKFAINVDILCLPKTDDEVLDDACIGSGWGRNESGEEPQDQSTEIPQSPQTTKKPVRPYVLDFDFGGGFNYHFERHAGGIREVISLDVDPFRSGSPLSWSPSKISVASERANPTSKPHSHNQARARQPNPTGQFNSSAFQHGLKYVELPTVPRGECESKLQETRLGPYFSLHESLMCAGGVKGKDTCKGDGGSPLICPIRGQEDRYQQVGIVAAGIGCGTDIPGMYANVAFLRPWIDRQVTELGFTPAYNY